MSTFYHAIQLPLFTENQSKQDIKTNRIISYVILICTYCSTEFRRRKSKYEADIRRYGERHVYCSAKCRNHDASRIIRIDPYSRNPLSLPPSIGDEYLQGKTLLDIARQYNTSESVIWNRLKKMDIPTRKPGMESHLNGHPMLGKTHTKEVRKKISDAARRQFSTQEARNADAYRITQIMMEGKISKSSKLEDLVAQELSNQGYAFTRQWGINVPDIKGFIGCVDFMLVDGRVIEVNGTYWHVDPRKYPDGPKNDTQRVTFEKYNKKKDRLIEAGIPLIELWEIDLKSDLVGTIKRALASH